MEWPGDSTSSPVTQAVADARAATRLDRTTTLSTRLSGRQLLVVRAVWSSLASVLLGLFVLLIPVYWMQLRTVCTGTGCALEQPSPTSARALATLGLSIPTYTALTFVITLLSSAVCFAAAGVIVWRKSDDWMALLVALVEVGLGTVVVSSSIQTGRSIWQLPAMITTGLTYTLLFLLAALFPSGRFVPRWTRWFIAVWIATWLTMMGVYLLRGTLLLGVYLAVWQVGLIVSGVAQVYRYRHVSNPRERAQTRWVVFGASAAVGTTLAVDAPTLIVPSLGRPGSLLELLSPPCSALATIVFSLAVGMAILRYRLYDIDVIIRRTLIYSVVTFTLTAAYFGVVLLLQTAFHALTGQGSAVAVVISTLAIAALFQPVRGRVRTFVDRRFYRRKYNAGRTLSTFGASVRNEMDLDELGHQLVGVVAETMQPSLVSLWLMLPEEADHTGRGLTEPEHGDHSSGPL